MNNFERALKQVFEVEGGFSDHPEDKGGKTMYGITERTLDAWHSQYPEVGPIFIGEITLGIARVIYRDLYWDKIRGDELPRGMSLMVFDSAVHAGPSRAVKWLQRAVGAKCDGIIGPKTLEASGVFNPLFIVKEIAKYRLLFARKNETFVRGWFHRIIHILGASIEEILLEPKVG